MKLLAQDKFDSAVFVISRAIQDEDILPTDFSQKN